MDQALKKMIDVASGDSPEVFSGLHRAKHMVGTVGIERFLALVGVKGQPLFDKFEAWRDIVAGREENDFADFVIWRLVKLAQAEQEARL